MTHSYPQLTDAWSRASSHRILTEVVNNFPHFMNQRDSALESIFHVKQNMQKTL